MATQVLDDDSVDVPETARANEELFDLIQQWKQDNSKRDIVIVVAGKSGTGKSTLINNFLGLDGSNAAETRLQPTSVTHDVKVYKGEVNGVLVRAVDMPGLHALGDSEDTVITESEVVAALSHFTDGKADILIYCASLIQRVDFIDEGNIATLNKAFGEKIWDNSILVLTWADYVLKDKDNARNFDEIVDKFTKVLQKILAKYEITACIKPFSASESSIPADLSPGETELTPDVSPGTEVAPDSNVAAEHEAARYPANAPDTECITQPLPVEIVAIPTGKELNKPPGWRDSLLAQIIAICQSRAVSKLTQLEGVSWEKIKKKLKKGAKVGAIAGAIGGVSGAAVGTGIGAGIGALVGGVLTAPIGGVGAIPTAAGGAALGAAIGSAFGGGGIGALAVFAGGVGSAHNNNLFKDIAFYHQVQKKLEELQKKELNESQSSA
jgi:GTPase Era involved in 16S rRNA processing